MNRRGIGSLLQIVFACSLVCSSGAEEKPMSLEVLSTKPSLWPTRVSLKVPISFKDASGKIMQAPSGSLADLIAVTPQGAQVQLGDVQVILPVASTDLLERLPGQAKIAAELAAKRKIEQAKMPKPIVTPPPPAANAAAFLPTAFTNSFATSLVSVQNGATAPLSTPSIDQAKYLLFYYSASWCGPCRKFTPRLVSFYNEATKDGVRPFEVVFVSKDRSEKAMVSYMSEAGMPWPAIAYSAVPNLPEIGNLAGPGIPCLVMTDRDGNVLADTYRKGEYVGPDLVLKDLLKTMSAESN